MLAASGDDAALLDAARDIAVRAGILIVDMESAGLLDVQRKPDFSVLTGADLRANEMIVAALGRLMPHVPIVSEEGAHDVGGGPARRFWLVDPLDGTREFIAGNGEYTVNIALVEDGVPTLGIVHAPARGVTYAAIRNGGAVRTDADGTQTIRAGSGDEVVVVTSRSHRGPPLMAFLNALPPHRTLAMGSALKMCLVADGSAQLYPRLGPTCWWDTAAGQIIANEAGATVTTLDGRELRYGGRSLLNPSFVCSSLPRERWRAAADAVAAHG
jgi:3'(2'), 5'-bisphosphate nucleotidase